MNPTNNNMDRPTSFRLQQLLILIKLKRLDQRRFFKTYQRGKEFILGAKNM
jgi:hypothetical protein